MSYNGWSNYETWNVFLWLGDYLSEIAIDYLPEEGESPVWHTLETTLKELTEEIVYENIPSSGIAMDLLSSAMCNVDWHEIAEAAIEQ